jgi:hypothetical protein
VATERESELRGLKFRSYEDHYLNSQVWLVKADQNMDNLNDILNDHLTEINKRHDYALELDLAENYFSNPDLQRNSRKETINKIDELIPAMLLQKHVEKLVVNLEHYYEFRKKFTYSFAMESFFSYLISNDFGLENMFFCREKGTFKYFNMKPQFNSDNVLLFKKDNYNSLRISNNLQVTNSLLFGKF